uniref:Era-type G domain-containing protein n=1 Tax=Dunaliella tertiolecta TaxID=3047 RepID=A0A7S3QV87_DUNTE
MTRTACLRKGSSQSRQKKQGLATQQKQQRRPTKQKNSYNLELQETDPMYLPYLTDEDLAEDPPDHKSGYVAVIGKPNAGKSTLINAIVGQKLSIVSFKPQTTRHRIMGIASDKKYQMILFDTPGIIDKKRTKLEERMMSAVVDSIQSSEAIIAVVDAIDRPKEALAMFQPGPDWSGPPMAVLLNKADLISEEAVDELASWYKENCRADKVFVGSAKMKTNVADLKEWAVSKLPLGPTLYPKGTASDQPEKFFVSEIIREKIFFLYDQEIPYCSQIHIAEFKERRRPAKDYIHAQILVERESQVPIIIGTDGIAIKKLGQLARKDIEDFLERPVFLELSVQCSEKWRDSKDMLRKYGYFDPAYV